MCKTLAVFAAAFALAGCGTLTAPRGADVYMNGKQSQAAFARAGIER